MGEGGYQVGQFPVLWAEWNGRYRDTVRRFWKGDEGQLSDFGNRLTGSSDLYQYGRRKPCASINFVTAHDGFTLCDVVATTKSTTKRTKTVPTITNPGTWEPKDQRTIRRSIHCERGKFETFLRPSCCRRSSRANLSIFGFLTRTFTEESSFKTARFA
jgi:hypothetical protein